MKKNLISVSQLTRDNNVVAEFYSDFCLIKYKDSGLVLPQGILKDGLYQLALAFAHAVSNAVSSGKPKTFVANAPSSLNKCKGQSLSSSNMSSSINVAHVNGVSQQWHARLGHPSFHVLQFVLNKFKIRCSNSGLSFCDSCKVGELHLLPFANCKIIAKKPLELLYSDSWGPSPVISTEGCRYYIIFVDFYTRYTWLYPLKLKFDALTIFKTFHKFAEL